MKIALSKPLKSLFQVAVNNQASSTYAVRIQRIVLTRRFLGTCSFLFTLFYPGLSPACPVCPYGSNACNQVCAEIEIVVTNRRYTAFRTMQMAQELAAELRNNKALTRGLCRILTGDAQELENYRDSLFSPLERTSVAFGNGRALTSRTSCSSKYANVGASSSAITGASLRSPSAFEKSLNKLIADLHKAAAGPLGALCNGKTANATAIESKSQSLIQTLTDDVESVQNEAGRAADIGPEPPDPEEPSPTGPLGEKVTLYTRHTENGVTTVQWKTTNMDTGDEELTTDHYTVPNPPPDYPPAEGGGGDEEQPNPSPDAMPPGGYKDISSVPIGNGCKVNIGRAHKKESGPGWRTIPGTDLQVRTCFAKDCGVNMVGHFVGSGGQFSGRIIHICPPPGEPGFADAPDRRCLRYPIASGVLSIYRKVKNGGCLPGTLDCNRGANGPLKGPKAPIPTAPIPTFNGKLPPIPKGFNPAAMGNNLR